MAKKKFGKFVALATVSGVIAAGISYFLKYKSFNNELDEDFHDFEGDDDEFDGELPHASETPSRTYVTLNEKKEDVAEAAQAAVEKVEDTAKDAAEKAGAVIDTVSESAEDIIDMAAENTGETIDMAAKKAEDTIDMTAEKAKDMSDMVKNAVAETAKAVENAVESSMSTTIEDDDI